MQSRSGNRSSSFAPHNAYCCEGDDRWCTIAVTNDQEWKAFCDTAGELDWINHPKFATALARKENEDELDKLIETWTIDLAPEDVMTKLQAVGVAAAVVKTAQDIFDDPQVKFRDYLPIREHAEIGACHHQGWPALLSKTPYQLVLLKFFTILFSFALCVTVLISLSFIYLFTLEAVQKLDFLRAGILFLTLATNQVTR